MYCNEQWALYNTPLLFQMRWAEPVFVNLLRSPGIDYQPWRPSTGPPGYRIDSLEFDSCGPLNVYKFGLRLEIAHGFGSFMDLFFFFTSGGTLGLFGVPAWAVIQPHLCRPLGLNRQPFLHPLHVEIRREGDAVVLEMHPSENLHFLHSTVRIIFQIRFKGTGSRDRIQIFWQNE